MPDDAYAVTPYSNTYQQLLSVPTFGDLEAYARAVNSVPMLTPEQEYELSMAYRANPNDLLAAHTLVISHLRVVVAQARKYAGYGLPQGDLIQEGSIGLMKPSNVLTPHAVCAWSRLPCIGSKQKCMNTSSKIGAWSKSPPPKHNANSFSICAA